MRPIGSVKRQSGRDTDREREQNLFHGNEPPDGFGWHCSQQGGGSIGKKHGNLCGQACHAQRQDRESYPTTGKRLPRALSTNTLHHLET
jgi:hypothetical protein